jgi:hypothetical protein
MIYLFHLVTVIFAIYELTWILNPSKKYYSLRKIIGLSKEQEGKKWAEYSQEYKDNLFDIIFKVIKAFVFIFWLLIGLFTFNWLPFLAFIGFQLLIITPLNKIFKSNDNIKIKIHWINSVIGFLFSIFVIINQFHLKIDLLEYIK